jgi:hypothetical protein
MWYDPTDKGGTQIFLLGVWRRWGNPDPRRVYSVGLVRSTICGSLEAVEQSDWFWVGVVSSSDDGALQSVGVVGTPSPRPSVYGSTARVSLRPDSVDGGSRCFNKLKVVLWCCCASAMLALRGAGSSEHVKFDYLAATGGLRFQGASGVLAAAHRLLISVAGVEDEVQDGLICNPVSLDFSVSSQQ